MAVNEIEGFHLWLAAYVPRRASHRGGNNLSLKGPHFLMVTPAPAHSLLHHLDALAPKLLNDQHEAMALKLLRLPSIQHALNNCFQTMARQDRNDRQQQRSVRLQFDQQEAKAHQDTVAVSSTRVHNNAAYEPGASVQRLGSFAENAHQDALGMSGTANALMPSAMSQLEAGSGPLSPGSGCPATSHIFAQGASLRVGTHPANHIKDSDG